MVVELGTCICFLAALCVSQAIRMRTHFIVFSAAATVKVQKSSSATADKLYILNADWEGKAVTWEHKWYSNNDNLSINVNVMRRNGKVQIFGSGVE